MAQGRSFFVVSGIAVIVISLGFAGWRAFAQSVASEAVVRLRPDDAALVASGERLYAEHCASCHGAKLQGQFNWRRRLPNGRLPAPPHDASGHTWYHGDDLLFRITKYGPAALVGGNYQSAMPAYDGVLSDREIIAVLSFIKSRWPPDIQRRHDQMNAGRQ